MLTYLPTEILHFMIRSLPLSSIRNFTLINTYCGEIIETFDWDTYFKAHISNSTLNVYVKINIDRTFMKTQGKYLINIADIDKIKKWFEFYPHIQEINNIVHENKKTTIFFIDYDNKIQIKIHFGKVMYEIFGIKKYKFLITYCYEKNGQSMSYSNDSLFDIMIWQFIVPCLF